MPKVTAELYCSICFNDEETQDWTSLVACGHLFHDACIRRWVSPPPPVPGERKVKKPDTCPSCRTKIVRPFGRSDTSKENSRFRKLLFNSDVRLDLSSSPARLLPSDNGTGTSSSKGIKRNPMVVRGSSSDEDEMLQPDNNIPARQSAENDAILTESESDADNARPAQRAFPRRSGDNAREATPYIGIASTSDNNNRDNTTLGEARATIASKNAQLAGLRDQLIKSAEEVQTAIQARNQAIEELQVIEARLREQSLEIKQGKDEISRLKDERKGLSRTLRSEVDRVGELNSANRKLLDEITLLKQAHTKLKGRYEDLEESFNSTVDDLTIRAKEAESSRDSSKSHFTRIHDLNKRNEAKLERKRQRITHLEAELQKYRDADEARRKEKGKGRALDQDVYEDEEDSSFRAPRSRQVSNKSMDDTSLFVDPTNEDFEESLFITQVPDSDGDEAMNFADEDEFADLDAVLLGPKPIKQAKSANNSILRDPLKEWTNSESHKKTSHGPRASSLSISDSRNIKDGKKRSLTSLSNPSDKWADMAIYGRNKSGKSTTAGAAGDKKKARIVF